VRCGAALAFCEVTAGKNVLYVSRDGRFAMLGTLLDLRDRLNLTEKRVKELGEIEDITSKYGAPGQGSQTPVKAAAASGAAPTIPQTLAVNLPIANAVVHHPGAPLKVKVFSDYNCGYCRMLFSDLKAAPDIEVTEYPLSFLRPDSGDKAKIALCSSDRVSAADALYFGGDVKTGSDCAAASTAVAGNSEFAKQHGISGTPTLVRADGATSAGYMPLEQLRTWLKGAKA
jgi:thiol:disulfide interchange protein DsbC